MEEDWRATMDLLEPCGCTRVCGRKGKRRVMGGREGGGESGHGGGSGGVRRWRHTPHVGLIGNCDGGREEGTEGRGEEEKEGGKERRGEGRQKGREGGRNRVRKGWIGEGGREGGREGGSIIELTDSPVMETKATWQPKTIAKNIDYTNHIR